jgi:hypothetical protein
MRYRKNIIGPQVRKLRDERGWTLGDLATEFTQQGLFISKKALDRVESQREFVGSVEVWTFANLFQTGVENLYPPNLSTPDVLRMLRLPRDNQSHFATGIFSLD